MVLRGGGEAIGWKPETTSTGKWKEIESIDLLGDFLQMFFDVRFLFSLDRDHEKQDLSDAFKCNRNLRMFCP